jgi:hypothetical protein
MDSVLSTVITIVGVVVFVASAAFIGCQIRAKCRRQSLAVLVPVKDAWLSAPERTHAWARTAGISREENDRIGKQLRAAKVPRPSPYWPQDGHVSAALPPEVVSQVHLESPAAFTFQHAADVVAAAAEPHRLPSPPSGSPLDVGMVQAASQPQATPVSFAMWCGAPWTQSLMNVTFRWAYRGGLSRINTSVEVSEATLTFGHASVPQPGVIAWSEVCPVSGRGSDRWGSFTLDGGYTVLPASLSGTPGDMMLALYLMKQYEHGPGRVSQSLYPTGVWTGVCLMPASHPQPGITVASAYNVLYGRWHLLGAHAPDTGDWAALPTHAPATNGPAPKAAGVPSPHTQVATATGKAGQVHAV